MYGNAMLLSYEYRYEYCTDNIVSLYVFNLPNVTNLRYRSTVLVNSGYMY